MTKKQIASDLCKNLGAYLPPEPHDLRNALSAIIDALPDEAREPKEGEPYFVQKEGVDYKVLIQTCYFPNCEDTRKLRIMKAMEEIAKGGGDSRFHLDPSGQWYQITSIGLIKINDMYSPEEPLWEGEVKVKVQPNGDDIIPAEFIPNDPTNWRRIKVREVRE